MAKAISRLHKKEHRRVKKALKNKWVRAAVVVAAIVFTAGVAAAGGIAAGGFLGTMQAGAAALATTKGMAVTSMLATAGGAIAKAEAQSKMFDRMMAAEAEERQRRESNTDLRNILIKEPYKALLAPLIPLERMANRQGRQQIDQPRLPISSAMQQEPWQATQEPQQPVPQQPQSDAEQQLQTPAYQPPAIATAAQQMASGQQADSGYVAPDWRRSQLTYQSDQDRQRPSLARKYGLTLREIMEGASWRG